MRKDVTLRVVRGGRYGEPTWPRESQLVQNHDALKPVSRQLMPYACRLVNLLNHEGYSCRITDNKNDVLIEVSDHVNPEVSQLIRLRDSRASLRRFGHRHYLCAAAEDLDGKPIDIHKPPTPRAVRHVVDRFDKGYWDCLFAINDSNFYSVPQQMRMETSENIPALYSHSRTEVYLKRIENLRADINRIVWQPASPLQHLRDNLAASIYCPNETPHEGEPSPKMDVLLKGPQSAVSSLAYAIQLAGLLEMGWGVTCGLEFSQVRTSRIYFHVIDESKQVKIANGSESFDHVIVLLDTEKEWESHFPSHHRFLILGALDDREGCPIDLELGPRDYTDRYITSWMDQAYQKRQEVFLP